MAENRADPRRLLTQQMEQVTGIQEHPCGLGRYYANGGRELSIGDACIKFLAGKEVEIPAAGAASWLKVLPALGALDVRFVETDGNTGDWTLAARTADGWHFVTQRNRHPGTGFGYTMDKRRAYKTFDDVLKYFHDID